MLSQKTSIAPSTSPRSRRGAIVLELLMALPVMVAAMDLVVRLTFDAAFMTGLSAAAMEAAREGAQAFPQSLSPLDPRDPLGRRTITDSSDLADRIALVVERRLRLLRLRVLSADQTPQSNAQVSAVNVAIRRGALLAQRGDSRVPTRFSSAALNPDDIEVTVAVRLGLIATVNDGDLEKRRASRSANSWFFPDIVQASARMPLE